jgi:DNA methylase
MAAPSLATESLTEALRQFNALGSATHEQIVDVGAGPLPVFTNEFWTARQRAAHSLHEVSYRACFKPQLPRFFIERLTAPGDLVYDPFMGRGTTLLESALLGRRPAGCDINPLSRVLCEARLQPPSLDDVRATLGAVDWDRADDVPDDLLVFYHPETLQRLCALREHLLRRDRARTLTAADRWVRMVAVNRLTGHSPGFFSAYSLPPNQAVSVRAQARINERLQQAPPPRDVAAIIERKSRSLLADVTMFDRAQLEEAAAGAQLLTGSSTSTPALDDRSVSLVVTSPPFLDVVDYRTDNWLRCWFCGVDADAVPITMARRVDAWQAFVTATLRELARVLVPGGFVAFEVGEVRGGTVRLDEVVVPAGVDAGLVPRFVLVNAQQFTKTANCWGVTNNAKGTNTNRIVVLQRPA